MKNMQNMTLKQKLYFLVVEVYKLWVQHFDEPKQLSFRVARNSLGKSFFKALLFWLAA
ncbi:MAG: hypothetical protein WCN88_04975 [Candidatus Falkowbacteria bacterium]